MSWDENTIARQLEDCKCGSCADCRIKELEALCAAQRRALKHVEYLRHAAKRYAEVGKTHYSFAKLNGPLSAIERDFDVPLPRAIQRIALLEELFEELNYNRTGAGFAVTENVETLLDKLDALKEG